MLDRLLIRARPYPSEPPRRRGATSIPDERDHWRFVRHIVAWLLGLPWLQFAMGFAVLVVAALIPWGTGHLLTTLDRQIGEVEVRGELIRMPSVELRQAASRWEGRSYFSTNLQDVKVAIEEKPWIESAAVSRRWPNRLIIEVREERPLAYWNQVQVISRSGAVIRPANPSAAGDLPVLAGPDDRLQEVFELAREMAEQLDAQGLGFSGLTLEQRGAWTLHLANGIDVVLGRDQTRERFARFLAVYEQGLAARVDEVERIDARYSNGIAVQWKDPQVLAGKNT